MDESQWLLFVICICFKVSQTEASSWTATVPNQVKGLLGSCVVIPCSYDYPDPRKSPTSFTGIWRNTKEDQVIYHSTESKILQQYQSRTKLVGKIEEKNCSLLIENLQQYDDGQIHFRIEIGGYNRFSYSNYKVSISVVGEPNPVDLSVQEEVKEGQTVSASCSVSHSCPTYPPDFRWSHSGEQRNQTLKLQNGQWKATSTLTFHPNRTDHNKALQCGVTYHGGKHQGISKTLKVKYAPEIKNSSECSTEGGVVKCECIVESEPPSMVHFVLADRVLQSSKVENRGSVTTGTLQTDFGSVKFVLCLANNTLGSVNLTLSLPVNDHMQIIFTASGAGVILLIILIVIGVGVVKKRRGRSGAAPTPVLNSLTKDRPVESIRYAPAQRKNDYEDVDSNGIYSNDNVYGNVGTDWDESIYANM